MKLNDYSYDTLLEIYAMTYHKVHKVYPQAEKYYPKKLELITKINKLQSFLKGVYNVK